MSGLPLSLNLNSIVSDIGQNRINAQFVDYAHALSGHLQFDESLLRLNPKTVRMDVRRK